MGAALYCLACLLAWAAPSLEMVVAARILQGFAAAAARVVPMAMTRDYYKGRGMARIVSFIMMVFTLVPAIAPLMGSYIIALAGWRALFAVFVLFALVSAAWLALRVAEPLPPEYRRPFHRDALWAGVKEVLAHPVVRVSTAIQALCMTILFASLSSIHQIFDTTYGRGDSFPLWFAAIALISGAFSLLSTIWSKASDFSRKNIQTCAEGAHEPLNPLTLVGGGSVNASIVERFGMRSLVRVAMVVLILLSLCLLLFAGLTGPLVCFPCHQSAAD